MPNTRILPKDINTTNVPTAGQVLSAGLNPSDAWTWTTATATGPVQTVALATNVWNDYSLTIPWVSSYAEIDLITFRLDNTNTGATTMNVNWLWVKQMVWVNESVLLSWVLSKNDTYILRYEGSIDRLVVAWSSDINLIQTINGNFLDLPWLSFGGQTFPLPWMADSNGIVYDGTRFLYISNNLQNLIHKFDTQTNTQVATVWSGGNGPRHFMSIFWNFLYYTNFLWNNAGRINLTTFTQTWSVSAWIRPSSFGVDKTWTFWYITNLFSNSISKINLATFTFVSSLTWILAPFWREFDDFWFMYTGSLTNSIRKIDLTTFTLTSSLPFPGIQYGLKIVWDFLYCTAYDNDLVYKVNLSTFLSVWTVSVWDLPSWMAVYNNYLYVANTGSNNVSKINLTTFLNEWNTIVWSWPQEIAVVWSSLYVVNESSNNISIIPTANLSNPAPWFFRLYFDSTGRLIRRNSAWVEQIIWVQV